MSIFSLGENNPIEGLRGSGEFELFLVDFANRLKIEQEDIDNTFAAVSQFVEETGKRYADTTDMLGSMADVNVHRVTSQEQRTQEIVDGMSGRTILSTDGYEDLESDPVAHLDAIKPSNAPVDGPDNVTSLEGYRDSRQNNGSSDEATHMKKLGQEAREWLDNIRPAA